MDKNQEDFDLIIFSAVLHHLFDYEMALKKACEGLKSGTKILIFFEPLRQEVPSSLRYAFHRTIDLFIAIGFLWFSNISAIPD